MLAKKIRLLGFLVLFLLLIGLGSYFVSTKNEKQTVDSWGIKKEQFNYNQTTFNDEEIIEAGENLLNGKLVVYDKFETPLYDLTTLDWNMNFTDSPNTFQLYLQSLMFLEYLSKAYELTEDVKYLDLGKKFLIQWDKYRVSEEASKNSFVWYDHGTALRANNIIYFVLTTEAEKDYFTKEEREWIKGLIIEHGEFLANDKNYTENHNHGIFQDQALLYIAYFLNNESKKAWVELAKNRLTEQKTFAFSTEMVHVENSPGYQAGVMELFREVAEFLSYFNNDFGELLYKDVKKSAEFMAYIMKPNGVVAEVGDTNSSLNPTNIGNLNLQKFENDSLSYASSKGKVGTKPEQNSKIFAKSGYYLSRNNWNVEDITMSTWMMFKSGYLSKTHKHADDNSFMLYSKGYDVFVDPGWYNYIIGNRYRDYFVASYAHNTVFVDGQTYSPTIENSSKVGIYKHQKTKNYDYVLGFNEMYKGVSFDRHFYNLGDAVAIYDNLESKESHTYTQVFHASEDMKIVDVLDNELLFKLGKETDDYFVRIKWLSENGKISIVHGDFDKESFGYISREMNHLDIIETVKYEVKGDNEDIITLITIENSMGEIEGISNIEFNNLMNKFIVRKENGNKYEIELLDRERIDVENVKIKQNSNNNFTFEHNKFNENASYSWYIIEKNSARPILKSNYDSQGTLNYTFKDKKSYFIKAYAKSKNSQYRVSRIIAEIGYDEVKDKFIIKNENGEGLNLNYLGHGIKKIDENHYEFKINFEYKWDYRVRWYIYRNGGYYSSFMKVNDPSLQFEFEDPGSYTVMYYLTTPNGDNEFWNFKEINIK